MKKILVCIAAIAFLVACKKDVKTTTDAQAMSEEMALLAALCTDEGAHILDDAEHRNVNLLKHGKALARVDQSQILGC